MILENDRLFLDSLSLEQFRALPLVVEGESKEVRYAGDGKVVIRFKPTIYSFTHNRCGVVDGSDTLRLKAAQIFTAVLKQAGVKHAYRYINDRFVLADFIQQPEAGAFVPDDLESPALIAPPIEVVLKRMHSGTSKHRYYKMPAYTVRACHPHFAGMAFAPDDAYPQTLVRFDWRNPLVDSNGRALQDEVMSDSLADYFIDTNQARLTALKVYRVLSNFLSVNEIICYDLCLFITQDGGTVFGEISQDCGRFRHMDLGSLDKDVWRSGGSSSDVIEKWKLLYDLISREGQS